MKVLFKRIEQSILKDYKEHTQRLGRSGLQGAGRGQRSEEVKELVE